MANLQIAGLVGKTTREKRPDIYDAIHRMIAQAPRGRHHGALEAMIARPDSTPTLATIDVPTLIIVGERGRGHAAEGCEGDARGDSRQPHRDPRRAGHLSNVERPAAFNTVVSEFLASLMYN